MTEAGKVDGESMATGPAIARLRISPRILVIEGWFQAAHTVAVGTLPRILTG